MARLVVDDPGDERIAEFVGLRERPLRRGLRPAAPGSPLPPEPAPAGHASAPAPGAGAGPGPGLFIAEGDIVVARALQAGYRARALLVDATRNDPLPPGVPPDVPVYAAAPAVLERITGLGVHRGVLGSFHRRPPRPPGEVVAGARRLVVLERVSNPTNLGIVLRSARALGIDGALLDPGCTDPLYRRVSRVAMGESYAFPWAVLPRLPAGLGILRAEGFRLVALTPDPAAVPLDRVVDGAGDDRVALLLGAEGPGLSPTTLAAADAAARIPMHGGVDSLNVGVAAGIAFWILGRPRAPAGPPPAVVEGTGTAPDGGRAGG